MIEYRWVCIVALLAIIETGALGDGTSLRQHPILNVDEHYCKESIAKGRSNFYQVGPLAPGFYEIRVSYRAINPVNFTLSLKSHDINGNKRRLLNTDKVMFVSDSSGKISWNNEHELSYDLQVHAGHAGFAIDRDIALRPGLQYCIVLESLFFGVPFAVFRILIIFIFVFTIFWFFIDEITKIKLLLPLRDES